MKIPEIYSRVNFLRKLRFKFPISQGRNNCAYEKEMPEDLLLSIIVSDRIVAKVIETGIME